MRREEWLVLLPGVYELWRPRDRFHGDLWAAYLWAPEGSVISHTSALYLHRISDRPPIRVDIVCRRSTRKRSPKPWVRMHQVTHPMAGQVVTIDGLRVSALPRTLCDLGSVLPRDQVEEAVEVAMSRDRTSYDALIAQLELSGGRGRPGSRHLRAILEKRGRAVAIASRLESRFLQLLRTKGFPEPERQFEIFDETGTFVARVDFAYPQDRIAIEIDGYETHGRRSVWEEDARKRNELKRLHWEVVQVTARLMDASPSALVRTIRGLRGESFLRSWVTCPVTSDLRLRHEPERPGPGASRTGRVAGDGAS